jgi:hypothetical protein
MVYGSKTGEGEITETQDGDIEIKTAVLKELMTMP